MLRNILRFLADEVVSTLDVLLTSKSIVLSSTTLSYCHYPLLYLPNLLLCINLIKLFSSSRSLHSHSLAYLLTHSISTILLNSHPLDCVLIFAFKRHSYPFLCMTIITLCPFPSAYIIQVDQRLLYGFPSHPFILVLMKALFDYHRHEVIPLFMSPSNSFLLSLYASYFLTYFVGSISRYFI